MNVFFLAVSVVCVSYYLILAAYSHKFTSTFAGFWLAAGGVHLIAGCVPPFSFPGKILSVALPAVWLIFLFVLIKIFRPVLRGGREKVDCIIVLGAQVKGCRVSDSLKRRLDRALEYVSLFPDVKIIVSGGQGRGEDIAEADAMAEYLIHNGADADRIFRECRSGSTRENFRLSREYIDAENEKTGIVTNGFHICRASLIAKEEGYRHVYAIPASSNPVYQLNYLAREFFALIQFWFFRRNRRKKGDNDE